MTAQPSVTVDREALATILGLLRAVYGPAVMWPDDLAVYLQLCRDLARAEPCG